MRVTRLQLVVLASMGWAFGLIIGGLYSGNTWRARLEECQAEHIGCSQALVDEQAELVQMIDAQQAQYLSTFEENAELRAELDACQADHANVFSLDNPAPSYLAPKCDGDPAEVCADYAFRTEAVLIEEEADALRLGLQHLRSAVALIDCAQADPDEWGDDVNLHAVEAWRTIELFISWRMVPPDTEQPSG